MTCLIRPLAVTAPTPRLNHAGELAEPVWRINPADEHALAQALAIQNASPSQVRVRVVAAGEHAQPLLREALATGAEQVLCLEVSPSDAPLEWCAALTGQPILKDCDAILLGHTNRGGDAPLGPFLAGHLQHQLQVGTRLDIAADGTQLQLDGQPLLKGAVVVLHGEGDRLRETLTGVARAEVAVVPVHASTRPHPIHSYQAVAVLANDQEQVTDVGAAAQLIQRFAEAAQQAAAPDYEGTIRRKSLPDQGGVWVVAQSHEQAASVFRAGQALASALALPAYALVVGDTAGFRQLAGLAQHCGLTAAFAVDSKGAALSHQGMTALLSSLAAHNNGTTPCHLLAPAPWGDALGLVAGQRPNEGVALAGVTGFEPQGNRLTVLREAYQGRLSLHTVLTPEHPLWATIAPAATFDETPANEDFFLGRSKLHALTQVDLDASFQPPVPDLRLAEVIVDIGFGAGTPVGLALAESLLEALKALHLTPYLGATRKVTQGLGLLPVEQQIGQTGVSVNPRLLIALGISGAPQHVDYLGGRAQVLALNKDPEAPLMGMDRPGLTVHPIIGDLFETVPALIAALQAAR